MRHKPSAIGHLMVLIVSAGIDRRIALEGPVLADRGRAIDPESDDHSLATGHHRSGRDLR